MNDLPAFDVWLWRELDTCAGADLDLVAASYKRPRAEGEADEALRERVASRIIELSATMEVEITL